MSGLDHHWRRYSEEERKRAPRFCPGCGNELSGSLGHTVLVCSEYEVTEQWWDTHCPICDWSGDISPDRDLGAGQAQ